MKMLAALALMLTAAPAIAAPAPTTAMYGQIGKIVAKPGQRDALAALLLEGSDAMPGCLSYVVAADAKDSDTLWVSEAWDSKASHDASLRLPAVRAAIAKAMPLIASFDAGTVTIPLGGTGLKR